MLGDRLSEVRLLSLAVLRRLVRYLVVLTIAQALFVVGVAATVSVGDIEAGRVHLSAPCPIRMRTGRPCPTCGMTRGVVAVLHGQFASAVTFNSWSLPFALVELTILVVVGGGIIAKARRIGRLEQPVPTRGGSCRCTESNACD